MWMGLEINLLSFVPMVISRRNEAETESVLKYFLVQAIGSGLILLGSFSIINYPNSMIRGVISLYVLLFSMIVKMGIVPFHYWLPHVMGGIR